jgi:hypothetical protein
MLRVEVRYGTGATSFKGSVTKKQPKSRSGSKVDGGYLLVISIIYNVAVLAFHLLFIMGTENSKVLGRGGSNETG